MPIMPPDKDAFLALLGNAMPGPLERGMELAKRGKVRIQNSLPDTVTARVQGTSEYRVMLGTTSGGVWSCTCPAAADGSFCKHCVATASIVGGLLNESPPSGSQGPGSERQRVETYVRSLDADALITIVIEQAEVDSGLEHRLLAAATAADGETIDVAEWKKKITAAFR